MCGRKTEWKETTPSVCVGGVRSLYLCGVTGACAACVRRTHTKAFEESTCGWAIKRHAE
jgi:hypothetical protein